MNQEFNKIFNEIFKKNLHVNNKIRRDPDFQETLTIDALKYIKEVTDKFNIPLDETELKLGDDKRTRF